MEREMDYKKLYLEQRVQSVRMELELLQVRFMKIQKELPVAIAELEEHRKSIEGKKKEEK